MSASHPPIVVLGAGLAGLACARELGARALVLEREAEVGGLARSRTEAGFTFDRTGHWLHLSDPEVSHLVHELLGDSFTRITRRAAIHSRGVTTPYPFQANTYGRPAEVVADCVLGYFRAREAAARGEHALPRTFEDFIRQRLGDGIARHFMLPYNTKLWTVPPAALEASWCERFVPTPTPEDVVKGALGTAGAGQALGYNASFLYPREGGIRRLPAALSGTLRCELRTATPVVKLDWRRRVITTATGEAIGYRAAVTTLPLPELVACLVEPPEAIAAAAGRLRSADVTYWDVGLRGANAAADAHWTYFPDEDVPFYRVGSPSAVAPGLAPPGHRSLYVEVSHRHGTAAPATEAEILAGLRSVGLVGATEEPVLFSRATLPHAYVLMDADYGEARRLLLEWLEGVGIHAAGRYGAWTYDSMEGAMLQGRAAARRAGASASR